MMATKSTEIVEEAIRNSIPATIKNTYYKRFCGIYFLIRNDKIVYIGRSTNIGGRVRRHIHEGSKVFDSFYLWRLENPEEKESELIYLLDPEYNQCFVPQHVGMITRKSFENILRSLGLDTSTSQISHVDYLNNEYIKKEDAISILVERAGVLNGQNRT